METLRPTDESQAIEAVGWAAVAAALGAPDFAGLERREPPQAGREALERVHAPEYVDLVLANMPERGHVRFDADTVASPGTKEAALRAAGATTAAVDALVGGEADTAFCAMRPPGHHAEPARAMGFCFFNSIAVGAAHARAVHGLGRVAIVDFDVHHGNGTQAVFWDEPDVLFASTHQMPLYPGTGAERECGAHGQVYNAPLPPGAGGKAFRERFEERVLPAVEAFRPELILVSAGFDAHRADPLAQLELDAGDFAWATRRLLAAARRHAGGRLAAVLEGGYDLEALENASGRMSRRWRGRNAAGRAAPPESVHGTAGSEPVAGGNPFRLPGGKSAIPKGRSFR